jgi:hypothetical protein
MFRGHLAFLKAEFFFEKFIGLESEWVKILVLLDEGRLDVSTSFSKITMKNNHATTLEPLLPCNLVTGLWSKIASSTFLHHQLSKCFALAKVAMVMVLGSMEYEYCFSTLSSMKSKSWN